jgi:hypothetical protein
VLAASRTGKLHWWDLSHLDVSPTAAAAEGSAGAGASRDTWLAADTYDISVDCVRFLTGTTGHRGNTGKVHMGGASQAVNLQLCTLLLLLVH